MLRLIAIALTLLATPALADPAAIEGLAQVIDGDTIVVEGTAPVQFAGTTAATSCKSATTCQEAVILWCGGYSRADGDGDGIPCENVCRTLKQVEAIKKDIGCAE